MHFFVRVVRHRGRILPAHEFANQRPSLGDLLIEAVHDAELRRYVTTASLRPTANVMGDRLLPELLDVRLIGMSPIVFSLTGVERIGGTEFAQSWIVSMIQHAQPASSEDAGRWRRVWGLEKQTGCLHGAGTVLGLLEATC